ncbi:MAG: hypothetical protein R3194_01790 [Limnobacter sp.]|nr:hypothetical protein [Limnobacter sp.]
MARQARLFIPDCPVLVELQGVGGLEVFRNRETFEAFHDRLPLSAAEEGVKVYSYCLVTNRVLMLLGVSQANQTGRFIQNLNRHFIAQYRQLNPGVAGCVWEPRFKSTVVQPGVRSLKACLFVEFQVTYAGLNVSPGLYPWSSHRVHTGLSHEPWLSDLPSYWQLGNTPFEREAAYVRFAEQGLPHKDRLELTECLQKGWLWAEGFFADSVEPLANRAVRPRSRGRKKLPRLHK